MTTRTRKTVVAYIEYKLAGVPHLLVVWNKKFGGWALPGGMVEPGEELGGALSRELFEETRLTIFQYSPLYDAPVGELAKGFWIPEDRQNTHAHVFRVVPQDDNYAEGERGSPVTLFTVDEFLRWSPFAPFYQTMFATLATEGGPKR